jgi:lipoprotein-releasing system permease protein
MLQKIFTRGGLWAGLVGTIAGIAAGIGLSLAIKHLHLIRLEPEIYFVSTLPIDISWPICGIIGLFSILMCWGTSKIAAKRLALLPIIENL